MTNNEKKSNEKWSLKKTILFIVLVVLLFATLFSCGLNTFKTTYNKVNQVNYDENTQVLTDYTSFNKIDKDIKKSNNNGVIVPGQRIDTIYFNYSYTNTNDLLTDMFANGVTISDFYVDSTLSDSSSTVLFYYIYNGTSNDIKNICVYIIVDNSTQLPTNFFITYHDGNGSPDLFSQIIITDLTSNDGTIIYERGLIYVGDTCDTTIGSYNVGYINDKISFFVSTTPFINNNGGGGTYTPNPQYNIVQPNINGDLVLGTLFEPMLESQTAFGELYVSYIIGASEYTYSLNMVINLVLEGTNNYYNIAIANNLNINDLNNSSFTNIIANFDSELEELSLVIEVYSNNSVIYTYNDSFPCVMNNSFTYPYQVIGFSNTSYAKQLVNSYYSNQAYNNGFNLGKQEGINQGYNSGYSDGLNQGSEQGYNNGYIAGKNDGYSQGYHDGTNNEFAKDGVKDLVNVILNAPYNIFNGFLNFEIFGVNLFKLLSFIFTLVLVGWIIALLMKR